MTPTDEIAALRRVVEAARRVMQQALDRYDRGEGMTAAEVVLDAALDALPAASPPAVDEGKTVELVLCVDHGGGAHMHEPGFTPSWAHGWRRLGTVRLPLIPTVEEPK
jgi:Xaa-Pro aminopeptidase